LNIPASSLIVRNVAATLAAFLLVGCQLSGDPPRSGSNSASDTATGVSDARPNIVLIVADDLGFSDIGSFGSEIRTPNLDSLATHGLRLTNFHTAPTCGPTRAMLMTGIDPHPVGMSTNAVALRRLPMLVGRPGYEGRLNQQTVTVATLLNDAGYRTYMTGKWDLGSAEGSRPVDRGFDRSFTLASAGASHFGDATGALPVAPKATYLNDDVIVTSLPDDFYSTRFYTDQMLDYVESGDQNKPFFAYVAYTAPHWPLQVPDDWLDRYDGRYDAGWSALRKQRLANLKALGLVEHVNDVPLTPGAPLWATLSASERDHQSRPMEIYAAMIEYMDWQIGRLLERIESLPSDRPTMVIFLSDNGPEGNAIDKIGRTGEWVAETFDTRLANAGRMNSYLFTGPGWAQASAQPYRLYKSFVTEGGIRTPAIISMAGTRPARDSSDALVLASDIPATILDAADVKHPGSAYAGRRVIPMEGKSVRPVFDGSAKDLHRDQPKGWELYGNRALIRNNWKALLVWPPAGSGQWQLFDIDQDPQETNDLSALHPGLLDELVDDWNGYADDNGIYLFEDDNGYGRY